MSRATLKAIQAAAGNAGETLYVDDVFSTYLYDGTSGQGPEASIDNLTTNFAAIGGLACDNAGTAIAAVDNTTYAIKSAILSIPYDIRSAGTTLSFDPTATTARVDGIRFNPTGSKLYATNGATDIIYQFSLSTAFDVSTASYDSVSLDMSTEMANSAPRGMAFSADGTTLAVVGAGSADGIYRYTLTTGFDLSTASYEDFFSTATQANNPFNMEFNGDGTKMFVLQGDFGNPSGMPLYQYSLSTAYNTSTASYDSVFQYIIGITPANHTGIYGMAFWRDGTGLVATSYPGSSGTPSQTTSASFISYDITTIDATKRITNGIDLAGEGGLVWVKNRNQPRNNQLYDTARGATKRLQSNSTDAEYTSTTGLTSFNSDGLSTGTDSDLNADNDTYASWTFRKQPGFFDVVTYTGTGNAGTPQTINHNLDSAPAVILVKKTNSAQDWLIFSKDTSQPHNKYLILNSNVSEQNYDNIWGPNGYLPTTTEFKVDHIANDSGATYVAYLFADNDQRFGTDSDEAIIKSNSVSATGLMTVDLGFEPQWVLIKSVSITNGWILADSMRGLSAAGIGPNDLFPNLTSAESVEDTDKINLTSTGFTFNSSRFNGNGTYLYIAIRRPHKPASEFAATDLFDPVVGQTSGKPNFFSSTGVVDALFRTLKTSDPGYPILASRLTSPNYLITSSTAAEVTFPTPTTKFHFAMNDGWGDNIGGTSTNVFVHMLRRAPGFFDVVGYAGVGGGQTINHGLGAVPEMIVIKNRTQPVVEPWTVGHHGLNGGSNPWEYWVQLNDVNAEQDLTSSFADFQPTTTQFKVGNDRRVDFNGNNFIAYLFATVSGISKVGSYTGTGSDVNVNCGFTSGARFVLVKRADSTGGWYLWDSANGITAGNDPYILLNSTAGQTTGTDYIDPLSSGFTITSTAPAALNASGGNYIFLAIA
jgi:hypothetical protein